MKLIKFKTVLKGNDGIVMQIGLAASQLTRGILGATEQIPNPNYPKENYEDFIKRMIHRKMKRIELELGVENLSDES